MLFVKSKPGAARLGFPLQRVASRRPATRLATIHRRGAGASPAHVGRRRRQNGVVCGVSSCSGAQAGRFWLGCGLDCQGCATAPGAASGPDHVTWSRPSLGGVPDRSFPALYTVSSAPCSKSVWAGSQSSLRLTRLT